MIQLRIFTRDDLEPASLMFAESEEPQIQLELADGTRIRLAHFAEGRAEITVSGLLGDEVHIRPRSNVFDVVTAPGTQRTSGPGQIHRGEE
jgi:hypothetical protein